MRNLTGALAVIGIFRSWVKIAVKRDVIRHQAVFNLPLPLGKHWYISVAEQHLNNTFTLLFD
jgi:hypothetical protein